MSDIFILINPTDEAMHQIGIPCIRRQYEGIDRFFALFRRTNEYYVEVTDFEKSTGELKSRCLNLVTKEACIRIIETIRYFGGEILTVDSTDANQKYINDFFN